MGASWTFTMAARNSRCSGRRYTASKQHRLLQHALKLQSGINVCLRHNSMYSNRCMHTVHPPMVSQLYTPSDTC